MFTSASILGGLICRRLPPAGGGHPKPARYVGHVPEPDQPTAVFGGIIAGGSSTADLLTTLSRDANSEGVSGFDFEAMIRL
jgi:hypothetical protein